MLLTRKPNLGCVKVPSWDILGVFFSSSLHQASLLQPLMFHWCSVGVPMMFPWCSTCVSLMFLQCSSDVPLMDHSCSNAVPMTLHWRSNNVPLMFHYIFIMFHRRYIAVPVMFHWRSIDHQKNISSKRSPSDDLRIGTCVAGRPEYSVPVPDHQQRLGDKSAKNDKQMIKQWFWGIFIWFPALSKNQMPKMIRHEKHMINNWFWRSKRPLA